MLAILLKNNENNMQEVDICTGTQTQYLSRALAGVGIGNFKIYLSWRLQKSPKGRGYT